MTNDSETPHVGTCKEAAPLRGRKRPLERVVIVISLFVAGAISIAVTIGILWELASEALAVLPGRRRLDRFGFFTETVWQPQAGSVRHLAADLGHACS